MISWRLRPPEVAHLLNPAFVAVVLSRVAGGYLQEVSSPLPWPLAFLAAPLVLHRATREKLPRTVRTRLAVWLSSNPEAHVGFADRVRLLAPFIREGASFGLARKALELGARGELAPARGLDLQSLIPSFMQHEENVCLTRAFFVGRWFGGAGSTSTVFTLWGVRP